MVWIFQSAGKKNSNNKNHQFWQQDNHPIELSTNAMIDQRLHYIHMNSVKERIIDEPEHYVYSTAKDYSGGKGLIDVDFLY
jgi:putative transposase